MNNELNFENSTTNTLEFQAPETIVGGIIPTETLEITSNGVYDVTNFAKVVVNISDNTGEINTAPILDNAILGTMILQ